jgi:hypothetical protein
VCKVVVMLCGWASFYVCACLIVSPQSVLCLHFLRKANAYQRSCTTRYIYIVMDSQRTLTKQPSHLRNIPSINDFNTLTREDMESDMATRLVEIPRLATDRSWSVDTNSDTPRRYDNAFSCATVYLCAVHCLADSAVCGFRTLKSSPSKCKLLQRRLH